MTIDRRTVLKAAAFGALASPAIVRSAFAAEPIKLGTLFDISGIFDAYGKPIDMAVNLAISQINDGGGVNGRMVKRIGYDTQSDIALYTQYVQKLIHQDKVDVVHGGILSASREAIRQILHRARVPYFYNTLYEGGVCDRNIFVTGVTPAQQLEPLIPFAMNKWGKKVYVIAADYNYGQIIARWAKKYAADNGGTTVAIDFFPLNVSDFGSAITKIQAAKPDMLFSALVGGPHLSFYRQWAASGMKDKIPIASPTLGVGNEQKVLTAAEGDGILCCYNYSAEIDTPANNSFKAAWKKRYGDLKLIHEIAVSNYQGIMLWAAGVKKAGSPAHDALVKALEGGVSIEGPGGHVAIDPQTHHAILDVHIMEIRNQKLNVLKDYAARQPTDTQAVCNLIKNPNDDKQYQIKV